MNLLEDLLSPGFAKVASYLKDLVRFVLAPGDFLRHVATEADLETTRRLVFYAVGFAILEMSTLSIAVGGAQHLGLYTVLGIASLETVLGLPFLPCFYLVGKYLRV